MKSWQALCATLCCYVVCSGATAAEKPLPAAVFGHVPDIKYVTLSPSGVLAAWLDNSTRAQKVVIFDLDARRMTRTFDMGDNKVRGLDWADDSTLLMNLSAAVTMNDYSRHTYEFFRVLAADLRNGSSRMLLGTGDQKYSTGTRLQALRTGVASEVIMANWDFNATQQRQQTGSHLKSGRKDEGFVLNLFSVDTRTGKGRVTDTGTPFTVEWIVDRSGKAVARSEYNPVKKEYRLLAKAGGGWKEIYRADDGTTLDLSGLTSDEASIVALGSIGSDTEKAWRIPLDGGERSVLVEDSQYDVQAILLDPYSQKPIAAVVGGPDPSPRWFDTQAEGRQAKLSRTFAGRDVYICGLSANATRAIAQVSTPSVPTIYYFIDFSKGTADIVGEDYPALADVKLGEVRALSFKARDGTDIPAYLTLPVGVEPKSLPLVVFPHGGPESRDEPTFNWWVQFMASRGYAVLQPQFRGSTGFGEEHRTAGYRQWGKLMQNDVTDGVRAMIEQGIADQHRICIVGASYGGYAALAGAAFTPDLYACAVSVAGVSDLPAMLGFSLSQWGEESGSIAYWRDDIGSPLDADVIAKSPINAIAAIKTPILLLHGVDDTVVPLQQSLNMDKALTAARKPHTFVKLPGEDHWLSRSETRTRVLEEIEKFLAQHLGT